ncbi:hypothetical protein GCM10027568_29170 [Humibacter soli]
MLQPVAARWGWALWEWLTSPLHYRAVHRLHVAAETGDRARLRGLLAPTVSVVVVSTRDGSSGIRVVQGIEDATIALEHGLARSEGTLVDERSVNSQAGMVITRAGVTVASIAVDFTGRLITTIWVRLDPATRRHWNTVYA